MQGIENHEKKEGITPRIIKSIFSKIKNLNEETNVIVKVSMFEIYKEKITVKLKT